MRTLQAELAKRLVLPAYFPPGVDLVAWLEDSWFDAARSLRDELRDERLFESADALDHEIATQQRLRSKR